MNKFKFILTETQKKITIIVIFVISNFIVWYFHTETDKLFTDFLYIPILLSAFWQKRKSFIFIIFIEVIFILFYFIFITEFSLIPVFLRIFVFIITALFISEVIYYFLSNHKKTEFDLNELNQVFNTIGNGLRIIDKDFNILRVNKTFSDLSGLTTDEILRKKCYDVFPSNLCNTSNCCLKKIITDKKPFEIDATRKLKDGSDFFCILNTAPFYGETGEFIGIIEDCKPITKRKQLENKLIETSNYLESLINFAGTPIIVWNSELKITKFNHASELLTGYKEKEILNKEICILFPEDSKQKSMNCIKLTEKGEFLESIEMSILCKNNDIKTVLWNSANIYDKDYINHIATIAQGQDITERKQTQEKILSTILKTEEKERARFAKDLHDGLGTLLSSINIYLSIIKSGNINKTEKQNMINFAKGLIDEAILNTKEIANNLKPNIINNLGLIPTIKSFCEKINKTGTINISFYSDIKKELKKELEVTLFRITKELINNTLKHAFADKININLISDKDLLILTYKDNGIGFDTNNIINQAETKGTGIQNIISRVKAINGTCEIKSNKKIGINVIIKVSIL
ncbi:MAG: PAS domain S-box protein [Bacteroidales bacterium]|nr:PAS domain S-box protein [Bacteroidales bacterium]